MGIIKAFQVLPGLSEKLTGVKNATKNTIIQNLVEYEDKDKKSLANLILDYVKSSELQSFIDNQTGRNQEILDAILYLDEYYVRLTA